MADPEKKPLTGKQGDEEGKGEEGGEEEKGCCDKFAEIIVETCKVIYIVIVSICVSIRDCLACIWYPIKEQCCKCIDGCDKYFNPWKDHAYSADQ